ncbi:MAG: UDP-N-acetylmuramoyl-L-alanyl-D-glutamate--2,6-diaminopimelate ligase [Patescibacteria group bacterium]
MIKKIIKHLLPKSVLLGYHNMRAHLTALFFGFPGRRLQVIAVTGTNGKSTVVSMIGQLLIRQGQKVGWASTASIRIGDSEKLNDTKLTTVSPAYLQRLLKRMVKAGCHYAIIEASSEGLAQGRLNGIPIQTAVFTNLTPEHIEAHGSFEKYARAKEKLFSKVSSAKKGKGVRCLVVNIDDPQAGRFLAYQVERAVGCTLELNPKVPASASQLIIRQAKIVQEADSYSEFQIDNTGFHLNMIGRFNIMNSLQSIAVVEQLGHPLAAIAETLPTIERIPGRLEFIEAGQPFKVLVDYAPEPASMAALYSLIPKFKARKIIHVFGSCGGGRDKARRPLLGKWVAERADLAIITNEDPYDEPPEKIINDIYQGALQADPKKASVEKIPDRRQAIQQALIAARPGDVVLITGKACEQWIMGKNGQKIPWDDRKVIRELFKEIAVEKPNLGKNQKNI